MSEISLLDLFKSGFNEAIEQSPWLATWKAQVDRLTTNRQAYELLGSMIKAIVPLDTNIRPNHARWLIRKRNEFYFAVVKEDANGKASDR